MNDPQSTLNLQLLFFIILFNKHSKVYYLKEKLIE